MGWDREGGGKEKERGRDLKRKIQTGGRFEKEEREIGAQ